MSDVCPACSEKYESDFRLIREYLYDNPNRNIAEVSEATGVSAEKIKIYLRNDRLEAVNNKNAALLDCKKCGKPIATGIYCEECRRELEVENRKENSRYLGDSRYKDAKMYTRFGKK